MRHGAWLNATPERAKNDKSETVPLSRIEQARKDLDDPGHEPDMPEVEAGAYLLNYLWEIGPTMSAGGYPGPITHEEIAAWSSLTGIELEPWESRFIRKLSVEYLDENYRAQKRERPAPSRKHAVGYDRRVVAMSLQQTLKSLADL